MLKIKLFFAFSFGVSFACFRDDVDNVLEQSHNFSLQYKGVGYISDSDDKNNRKIICTGTLIDPYTVLTCAHAQLGNADKYKSIFFNLPEKRVEDIKVDQIIEMEFSKEWNRHDIALLKFKRPIVDQGFNFPKINCDSLEANKPYESYSVGYGNAKIFGTNASIENYRHAIYHSVILVTQEKGMLCSFPNLNIGQQINLKDITSGLSFCEDKQHELEGLTSSTDSGGPLFYNDAIVGTLIGSIRTLTYRDMFQDLSNPSVKEFIQSNTKPKEKFEDSTESLISSQEDEVDTVQNHKKKIYKRTKK